MARYRFIAEDVLLDTETGERVRPGAPGWPAYVEWLRAGNEADPRPAEPEMSEDERTARAELAERAAMRDELRADAAIAALRTRTPAQVDAWIDANVLSLADARRVLKIIARVVALIARERI